MTKRDHAIAATKDLVSDFLYYDRKGDEDLGRDDMQRLIRSGELQIEDVLSTFEAELRVQWEQYR